MHFNIADAVFLLNRVKKPARLPPKENTKGERCTRQIGKCSIRCVSLWHISISTLSQLKQKCRDPFSFFFKSNRVPETRQTDRSKIAISSHWRFTSPSSTTRKSRPIPERRNNFRKSRKGGVNRGWAVDIFADKKASAVSGGENEILSNRGKESNRGAESY